MTTRSRIIAGASMLAGEPENIPLPAGIPHSLRYELCCDVEIGLLRDLNLSDQHRAVSSFPVPLPPRNREITINQADFESPAYVQVLFNPSDYRWQDVEIVNVGSLEEEYRARHFAIAFYDNNPQKAMLSWEPSLNMQETLRIWYDRSPVEDPDKDGTSDIDYSYISHLKLQLAAQFMELLGKTPGPVMTARLLKGEQQWRKFVNMSRQAGLASKLPWKPNYGKYRRNQWAADMIIR